MRRIAAFALFACLALGCESDTTVGTDMIVMPATASGEVAQEAARLCFNSKTRCWTLERSAKAMSFGTPSNL